MLIVTPPPRTGSRRSLPAVSLFLVILMKSPAFAPIDFAAGSVEEMKGSWCGIALYLREDRLRLLRCQQLVLRDQEVVRYLERQLFLGLLSFRPSH